VIEAVSRRRRDNTMVKRKMAIWQTMINKTLHRKQNIWLVIETVSRRRTNNTMVKRHYLQLLSLIICSVFCVMYC
jgi:hypothetical protein